MSSRVVAAGGLRAYARHRKVTLRAVQKAVASGRLAASVTRANGRVVVIDFAEADREWTANAAKLPPGVASGARTLADAQRIVAVQRGRALKLANDQKRGRLLPVEAATRQAFEFARVVRENVLNVPSRLVGQLSPEQLAILDGELRQALMTTAAQMEKAS